MKQLVIVALASLVPLLATGQTLAPGQLLVAADTVEDEEFARTVVLLILHGDEGSLGLFVNRPTRVDGSLANSDLDRFDDATRRLAFGGPVAITQILALVSRADAAASTTAVTDGIYVTADLYGIETGPAGPAGEIRFFARHVAWAPDQLEAELDAGIWQIATASPELVFSTEPDEVWDDAAAIAGAGLTAALIRSD